jgi:hypothetical protein
MLKHENNFIKAFIFLASIMTFFSCKRDRTMTGTRQEYYLDSTWSQQEIAYKYVYEGSSIKEVKRYFLNDINYPEKLIGKIAYKYDGNLIAEKHRYFFSAGTDPTQSLYFKYNSKAQLEEIKMMKPSFSEPLKLMLYYDSDKVVKVKISNDSIQFIYSQDGNIERADYLYNSYVYSVSNEANPLLKDNIFLNDYELSNQEFFNLLDIPVYFNKNQVLSVSSTSTPGKPTRSYKMLLNNAGLLSDFYLYSHRNLLGDSSLENRYQFWYKLQ